MIRTTLASLVLALLAICFLAPGPARASELHALQDLSRVTDALLRAGVRPQQLPAAFDTLMARISRGLVFTGAGGRSVPHGIASAARRELGVILTENPSIQRGVVSWIQQNQAAIRVNPHAALERIAARGWIEQALPAVSTRNALVEAAAQVGGASGGGGGGAAAAGLRQRLVDLARRAGGAGRGFLGAVGRRFGALMEVLASHTAQRILGIHAIASFTQAQINAALHEYEQEMISIEDAADAEAYNNNVRLLMERLRDGRLALPQGMSLVDALRRLRANLAVGRTPFDGLLPSAAPATTDDLEPVAPELLERLAALGTWSETETSRFGAYRSTWAWQGGRTIRARWQNGATADLVLVAFDGRRVVIRRGDPSGTSKGLTARYEGTLGPDGTIEGTFTFRFRTGPAHEGRWTARLGS